MANGTLMVLENRHLGSSREPPTWVGGVEGGQRFYFENRHGEQWVALLTGDRLLVSGGDIDWEELELLPEGLSDAYRGLGIRAVASTWRPAAFLGKVLGKNEVGWFVGLLKMAEDRWESEGRL